jgi:hypothetical protein
MSTDARHQPLSQADRLRQDAAEAAEVRKWSQHPDVIALRVERIRKQIDVLIWVGICLGLAFTMTNVQTFAASGAAAWTLPWLAAWLLDPMVSLVLIAVLRAEQVTARYRVDTGPWPHRTKWFAFGATYLMNTWQSYVALHLAGVVLHSVPPVLVFLASETAPVLRDRLTESVTRAASVNTARASEMNTEQDGQQAAGLAPQMNADATGPADDAVNGATTAPVAEEDPPTVPLPVVHEPASARPPARSARKAPTRRKPQRSKPAKRTLAADYLAAAREQLTAKTEVSPAWVRQVTGCSRGLSSRLAQQLRAEQAEHTTTNETTDEAANGAPNAVHEQAREAA